jgi:hypothetical protein
LAPANVADSKVAIQMFASGASGSLEVDPSNHHDDAGEIHQLAVAGTSGSSSGLPHLQQIQAAFGHHDITDIRAHVGGAAEAATGSMGARGYAVGDDVAFAATPDVRLAAHEAAHVVQQRGGVRLSGGVGRAGDEYEQHADAVADLVVRGESAQALLDERAHRGASGGAAVQRDAQADQLWLAGLHHVNGHYTTADGRELTAAEQRRLHRILPRRGAARTPRAAMTRGVSAQQISQGEHVEAEIAHTDLDDDRAREVEQTGSSRGPAQGGPLDSARGGTTRLRERFGRRRRIAQDQIDETRTQDVGLAGGSAAGESVDPTAIGVSVERREHGRRAAALYGQLVQRRREVVRAQGIARTPEQRDSSRTLLQQIDADIAVIAATPVMSRAATVAIAARHAIPVQEDVTTVTRTTDLNPLDGSVGMGRLEEHSVVELDGSGRNDSDQRSARVDLGNGAVERRHQTEETVVEANGASTTDSSLDVYTADMGEGRIDGAFQTRTGRESTTADGNTTGNATQGAISGGLIVAANETGLRLGGTGRSEQETNGTTTQSETSGALEITDRRVGASRTHERQLRRGSGTASARASADGSFSIDVQPIADGSGQYRLTFTIHIGVGGRSELSRRPESGDGWRASGSVTGTGRGDLVTTQVVSEAEAQRYLEAADRAERGEAVSNPPEFSRLGRLRAAGQGADALLRSGAMVGSSSSAAAMADGESIVLDMEVGVAGNASVGGTRSGVSGGVEVGGSGSVEVGGAANWRRTLQVEHITLAGRPRIRLTVTYHDDSELHAGGSLAVAGMAARARHQQESGTTDSVQFVVDPAAADYSDRYHAIVATTDRTQLRALAAQYAQDVTRVRHADTAAHETEYQVGRPNAMIGPRTRTTSSNDVTIVNNGEGNPLSLEATIEGGSDSDVRVRAGDHNIDVLGHSDTVRGELDPDRGMRVDVEASEQHIDPMAAITDGSRAMAEADGRGRAALVLARTPTEHLLNALREFNNVSGYHLSEADLERMSERAGDVENWGHCCSVPDPDVLDAWRRLRGALAQPRPDAVEARVDRTAAINLARVRALSTWMQSSNGHGLECITRVLRRWAESATHEVSAERLGSGYEWPVSLRDALSIWSGPVTTQRPTTLLARTEFHSMQRRYESALARPLGATEVATFHHSLLTDFDIVLAQVRSNTDFTSEARRSELLLEISQRRADILVRYTEFERRWNLLHVDCSSEGPPAEQITATRSTSAATMSARSVAYVEAGILTLQSNHERETQMLRQVQALVREAGDSVYFGYSQRAEAATICSQVHDLHRSWMQQIQDIRQAYAQSETAERTWRVSTGPGTPRHRELEPNVAWLCDEYARLSQHSIDQYWQNRVATWRQEGLDY